MHLGVRRSAAVLHAWTGLHGLSPAVGSESVLGDQGWTEYSRYGSLGRRRTAHVVTKRPRDRQFDADAVLRDPWLRAAGSAHWVRGSSSLPVPATRRHARLVAFRRTTRGQERTVLAAPGVQGQRTRPAVPGGTGHLVLLPPGASERPG